MFKLTPLAIRTTLVAGLAMGIIATTRLPNGYAAVNATLPASTCLPVPTPVIRLDIGSRYETDSKSRSDIDEDSNASVNEALAPIDKFIQNLSRDANTAITDSEKRVEKASCVYAAILTWAKADALSDMATMNANLAIPSRIGGIAAAYGQVRRFLPAKQADRTIIEAWLKRRANQTKDYFDTEAPKNASRNNLRAWASFAVGEVGILTRESSMTAWALNSNKTMIAGSNFDGSLPLEMAREKYALHYQLHAASALMTSVARLCESGYGSKGADWLRLRQIAIFSIKAVENPEIAVRRSGAQQKFDRNLKRSSGMLTWLEPYKALTGEDPLAQKLVLVRPLLNSKLGGDLTRIYGKRKLKC